MMVASVGIGVLHCFKRSSPGSVVVDEHQVGRPFGDRVTSCTSQPTLLKRVLEILELTYVSLTAIMPVVAKSYTYLTAQQFGLFDCHVVWMLSVTEKQPCHFALILMTWQLVIH